MWFFNWQSKLKVGCKHRYVKEFDLQCLVFKLLFLYVLYKSNHVAKWVSFWPSGHNFTIHLSGYVSTMKFGKIFVWHDFWHTIKMWDSTFDCNGCVIFFAVCQRNLWYCKPTLEHWKSFIFNESSQPSRNSPWHSNRNSPKTFAHGPNNGNQNIHDELVSPFMSQAWHFKVTWLSLTLRSDESDGQCVMIVT